MACPQLGALLLVEGGAFNITSAALPQQSCSDFKSKQATLFRIPPVLTHQIDNRLVLVLGARGNRQGSCIWAV
jgi:hypothetical protein